MNKKLTVLFLSAVVSVSLFADMKAEVSANPALPAKNLLPGDPGFEKTVKTGDIKVVDGGWKSAKSLHVGKKNAAFCYGGFGLNKGIRIDYALAA